MTTEATTEAKRRAYIFLDGAQPGGVLKLLGADAKPSVFKDYIEAQVDEATLAALKNAGRDVYCAPAPRAPQPAFPTLPAAAVLAADPGPFESVVEPTEAVRPIPQITKRNDPKLQARFKQLKQHAPTEAETHRLRVKLKGSLTQARRQAITKAGVTIDSLRGGFYQVRAGPLAQQALRALPFVAEVRDYDLLDTVTTDFLQELASHPKGVGTFDAQAHSPDEVERMQAAIARVANVRILSTTKTTVRFAAPYDDKALAQIGVIPEVMVLSPVRPAELLLDRVRQLVGAEDAAKPPPAGLDLTGKGEKIAVIDSGIMTDHPDFEGRIAHTEGFDNCSFEDAVGHGTHVAGIAAGSGSASKGKVTGVAPEAELVIIGITDDDGRSLHLPADLGELFKLAYDQGARIINCSWAKPLSGIYDPTAYSLDDFVATHPDTLIIIAAGNEGSAVGGEHALRTIGSPATAKNALTVGASGTDRPGVNETWVAYASDRVPSPLGDSRMSPSTDAVALLSSAGPTDSNGVKPDVTAPGVWVLAPRIPGGIVPYEECTKFGGRYGYLHGTSMAAPAVAGAAAVLRQHLKDKLQLDNPSAALMKALLVNATRRMPAAVRTSVASVGYPDFDQGFGRIDLSTLLPIKGSPADRAIMTIDIANGDPAEALTSGLLPGSPGFSLRRYAFTVLGSHDELRIALAWTDVAGNGLQNDIQLVVTTPSNEMIVGNPEHKLDRVEAPADNLTGSDRRNTLEQVRLTAPEPGEYYVRVWARNTLRPRQGYALAVCGQVSGPLAPVS